MSYEPTNWKPGDTVTSAKLNKMEQGIANNNNVIIETCEYYEEDAGYYTEYKFKSTHTLTEIIEWCKAGKQVIFCFPRQGYVWPNTEYQAIVGFTAEEGDDENDPYYDITIANKNSNINLNGILCYISSMSRDENTNLITFTIYSPD